MQTAHVSPLPVAETIRAQLGGNRFAVMTGARDFVGGPFMLQFRLPRGARDGINSVRIELVSGDDLYTVRFYKIKGATFTVVREVAMVYADQLRNVFRSTTGLEVSL